DKQKSLIMEAKVMMDQIRAIIKRMQADTRKKLVEEENQIIESSNSIKTINFASLTVALLLAVYSILTFNKENKARKESDASAKAFRKELEERVIELDNANKELLELKSLEKFAVTGRISRTIAHEVRNPLNNINLAIEHLRTELPHDDEIKILLDMVARNANRINVLISDLLNSTRAAHLNFEKASINDLVDQSLDLAQDRIKLNNIKVIKSYAKNICDLMVDPEKIKIAFLNIMVNAIEAMDPENGVLRLSTQVKEDKCIVAISDNGKGMDKESVSKLFEPYFTTKENGSGLGLTNTHNIIINHKASLQPHSVLGKGTTFTITFTLDR
ncbi:MAG: ATP-binding protein, partial [Chitinophagaceae bacterium]